MKKRGRPRGTWRTALRFRADGAKRLSGLQRYYLEYRTEIAVPPRCDNAHCQFHQADLNWNGAPLPLIIDHKSGNSRDNRPENLQYLCPNCDAQRENRGGKNRGLVVEVGPQGYAYWTTNKKKKNYIYFPGGLGIRFDGVAKAAVG